MAFAERCFCVRRVAGMSGWAWVGMHLMLYFALDVVTVGVVAHQVGDPALMAIVVSFAWLLPVHLAAFLLAALLLVLIRRYEDLSWIRFRAAAVGFFLVPPALAGLMALGGMRDESLTGPTIGFVIANVVVGLLVVQPGGGGDWTRRYGWADELPSMDAHRF